MLQANGKLVSSLAEARWFMSSPKLPPTHASYILTIRHGGGTPPTVLLALPDDYCGQYWMSSKKWVRGVK